MIRRFAPPSLRGHPPEVERQPAIDPGTSIESWLMVFGRLLQLPDKTKQAIRDELDQHLHERVRDLVLTGENEPAALRLAIEELGSAAELARRFKSASRRNPGRLIMYSTLIGLGAASLITAGMFVSSAAQSPAAVYYNPMVGADERVELAEIPVAVAFDETPLEQVFDFLAKVVESDLITYWCVLEERGIDRDKLVTITLEHKRPLSQVIALVLESVAEPGWPAIDWRYGDDLMEFSTRDYFDRREVRLATFDVAGILEDLEIQYVLNREASTQKLCGLIYQYVAPEAWESNGGSVAHLSVVGTIMLIRAPQRFHAEVQWILAQLSATEQVSRGGRGGAGGRGGSGGAGGRGGSGGAGGRGGGGGSGGGGGGSGGDGGHAGTR